MSAQPSLFAAVEARDEAIDRVERHAPTEWKHRAAQVVRDLAASRSEFTTDDVWERIGPPPEPRALGAVMKRAAEAGLIVNTQRVVKSRRPECHARPLAVWRSRG